MAHAVGLFAECLAAVDAGEAVDVVRVVVAAQVGAVVVGVGAFGALVTASCSVLLAMSC